MMSAKSPRTAITMLCLLALPAATLAEVPRIMFYRGKFGSNQEQIDLTFSFWDAESGGNILGKDPGNPAEPWIETHHNLLPIDGAYTVYIGSVLTGGIPNECFATATGEVWLDVAVNTFPSLLPRQQIGMVPFAAKAEAAEALVQPGTFDPVLEIQPNGDVLFFNDVLATSFRFDDGVFYRGNDSFNMRYNAGSLDLNGTVVRLRSAGGGLVEVDNDSAGLAFGANGGMRILADGTAEFDNAANVPCLNILGGCDLAEPFAIAGSGDCAARIRPGMVVVIDPAHPGQLKLASEPYDAKVAGIISGANGLNTGMMMRAAGNPHLAGDHPVALTGRVWCWCDASTGAIQPGDRLTTSATLGHAMRVADSGKADGAVIGKAMTPLAEGCGLVLVLVGLQ